jgi:hypothetical protein
MGESSGEAHVGPNVAACPLLKKLSELPHGMKPLSGGYGNRD